MSVTGGFSNVLDAQIDQQLKDKKVTTDFAVFQTVQDFARRKNEGALANFKPEPWDKIDPSFKDPDGAWVAVGVNAMPYAYNPNLVKPEEAPRSALDFLKPAFKDAPHPNAARLFLNWFMEPEQQSRLAYWSPRGDVARLPA